MRPAFPRRLALATLPFLPWAVYAVAFVGHALFRSVGDELFTWRNLERTEAPLLGTSASAWLQANLAGSAGDVLDRIATGLHLLWFAYPVFVGIAITIGCRARLIEYLCWLTAAWYLADVLFLLLPVVPPWMADPGLERTLLAKGWIEYAPLDSNPVAAFPSLHACVPLVVGLFLWLRMPGLRWAAVGSAILALATGAAVVYLGEHWVLDVVAGWALAAFVAWLFVSRRVRSALHRIPGDPLSRVQALDARIAALGSAPVTPSPAIPVAPETQRRAA